MKFKAILLMLFALAVVAGCQKEQTQRDASNDHTHRDAASAPDEFTLPDGIDATKYVLETEPEDALNVISARESVETDEEVVILGRIGGGEHPWVSGRAAFSIVDPSLKACSDIPGDGCPAPWDYCCETDKLPHSSAFVTIVDEQGDVIKADARALLEVKELSTVVVKGKAKRDEEGNLTVLASGVFVKSL